MRKSPIPPSTEDVRRGNLQIGSFGDGDYKKLVDYLVKRNVFKKLLFPNKKFASSLYKKTNSYFQPAKFSIRPIPRTLGKSINYMSC